jgi:hypothetical protein
MPISTLMEIKSELYYNQRKGEIGPVLPLIWTPCKGAGIKNIHETA